MTSFFPSLDVLPDTERSVYTFVEATKNALRQYMTQFNTPDMDYSTIVVSPEESRDRQPNSPIPDRPVDYEIIISASGSELSPDDWDYTGDLLFRLTMEAFCVKRRLGGTTSGALVRGQIDELIGLNDAHRILYWSTFSFVGAAFDKDGMPVKTFNENGEEIELTDTGQRSLNIPPSGSVERGIFIDVYGQPVEDLTRSAYKAQWEVMFAYAPAQRSLSPELVDQSFGINLPDDYDIGDNVTTRLDIELTVKSKDASVEFRSGNPVVNVEAESVPP